MSHSSGGLRPQYEVYVRKVYVRTMTAEKSSSPPPPEPATDPGTGTPQDDLPVLGPPGARVPTKGSTGATGASPGAFPDAAPPGPPHGPHGQAAPLGDPPLIAVYTDPHSPPLVVRVDEPPALEEHLPELIAVLTERSYALAQEQGGQLPIGVFRELIANLVHASFADVVVTILDNGNTIRVSDRGPGIPDKAAALRPGFTSADTQRRRFVRGVGSGFSIIKETLAVLDGDLEIEDNLSQGTVVTVRVPPPANLPLAPAPVPSYNLSERQLKTLLLAVELAPVGPTRLAEELGVSTSTAYRDLVFLEEAGLVVSGGAGHRSVTDVGIAYLDAVL